MELGVPIINKRISVTPVSMVGESCDSNDYVPLAKALDEAGKAVGVNFIGGFLPWLIKVIPKVIEILFVLFPKLWQ